MGYLNDRTDLVENAYVSRMIQLITKINAKCILDMSQGCQGKTSFYLQRYYNNDKSKHILSIVPSIRMKKKILDELQVSYCEDIIVVPLKYNNNNDQVYDTNWDLCEHKFNFINIDAPYLSDVKSDNARIDIFNIIERGKLDLNNDYIIMFHDAKDAMVRKTVALTKQLLKANFYEYNDCIILTNTTI